MEKAFLGIDAGSSGVKVCAFNFHGELLAKAARDVTIISKTALSHEIAVEEYGLQVEDAIREVTAQVKHIVSIGFSVACPTLVLLDKQGKPVCNAITYLDGRSEAFINQTLGDKKEYVRSLTHNSPGPSACWVGTLGWLQKEQPELMKKSTTSCC